VAAKASAKLIVSPGRANETCDMKVSFSTAHGLSSQPFEHGGEGVLSVYRLQPDSGEPDLPQVSALVIDHAWPEVPLVIVRKKKWSFAPAEIPDISSKYHILDTIASNPEQL